MSDIINKLPWTKNHNKGFVKQKQKNLGSTKNQYNNRNYFVQSFD